MIDYKAIRNAVSDEMIKQIILKLPKLFSSKQFADIFLAFFPQEKAVLLVELLLDERKSYVDWINRCYLPLLAKNKYIKKRSDLMKKEKSKRIIHQKKWTKDLNYKEFHYIAK